VQTQQNDWKRQRWLKLDTKLLQNILDDELEQVNSLPYRSHSWDVHVGMLDTIVDMQVRLSSRTIFARNILKCQNGQQLFFFVEDSLSPKF
jgi:hypothetical protein